MTCEDYRAAVTKGDALTSALIASLWRHGFMCPPCRSWHDDIILKLAGGDKELVARSIEKTTGQRTEIAKQILGDDEAREIAIDGMIRMVPDAE